MHPISTTTNSRIFVILAVSIALLVTLPLFGKQSERYYKEKLAREIGGQVEVVMRDGTRCDILTSTYGIEVDFAKKWVDFKIRDAHGEKPCSRSNRSLFF